MHKHNRCPPIYFHSDLLREFWVSCTSCASAVSLRWRCLWNSNAARSKHIECWAYDCHAYGQLIGLRCPWKLFDFLRIYRAAGRAYDWSDSNGAWSAHAEKRNCAYKHPHWTTIAAVHATRVQSPCHCFSLRSTAVRRRCWADRAHGWRIPSKYSNFD